MYMRAIMSVRGGMITFSMLKENLFLLVLPCWPFAFTFIVTVN